MSVGLSSAIMRFRRSIEMRSLSIVWITTCWIDQRPTFAFGSGTASRSSRVRPRIASATFSPPCSNRSISSLCAMAEPLLHVHYVMTVEARGGDERDHAGDEHDREQP